MSFIRKFITRIISRKVPAPIEIMAENGLAEEIESYVAEKNLEDSRTQEILDHAFGKGIEILLAQAEEISASPIIQPSGSEVLQNYDTQITTYSETEIARRLNKASGYANRLNKTIPPEKIRDIMHNLYNNYLNQLENWEKVYKVGRRTAAKEKNYVDEARYRHLLQDCIFPLKAVMQERLRRYDGRK